MRRFVTVQIVTTPPVAFWHSISGTLPNKLWRQASIDILQELDVQLSDMAQNSIGPTPKKGDANPLIHFRKQKLGSYLHHPIWHHFFGKKYWYFPVFLRQNYRFQITLPKTDSHRTWKWMVGRRSGFIFIFRLFRGILAVSFRECIPRPPSQKIPFAKLT